jgi:recombination protein RecA
MKVQTDQILESMQEGLDKAFGAGTAMRLSSASVLSKVEHWVSTRSIVVDKVLAGGRPYPCSLVPFGRQMEISGDPGVGKTTLCAHIAAEVQSKGGFVVVTDTEERIDHPYWEQLGVDTSRILLLKANTLEEVFTKQHKFIQMSTEKWKDTPIMMLWDSVGGTSIDSILNPEDKNENPMDAAKKVMMNKARIISSGMELLNPHIAKSRIAYIYTNTMYTKPNVKYGDPMETPGGRKLKYFATIRLRMERSGQLKDQDDSTNQSRVYGHTVDVKALKNSMAPMLIELEGAIIGGQGFSNEWTIRAVAEKKKLITKAGAWSTWTTPKGEEVKFQGFNGFMEKVAAHPEYPDLEAAVIGML